MGTRWKGIIPGILSLLLSSPLEAGEVVVLPPHSKILEKTLADWADAWWMWVLSVPKDRNPVSDPDGRYAQEGQSGPVFFLAGNFGGKTERVCSVPCGRYIFFPLVNNVTWIPLDGNTCAELQRVLKENQDTVDLLECEIDGKSLENLDTHREASAGCYEFTPVCDNVFEEILPCTPHTFSSDGHWLMIAPLEQGEHVIHFKGRVAAADFSLDITYTITVGTCLFRRGDSNDDGTVDLADAVHLLQSLFSGGLAPACKDAADSDDNGELDVTDAIRTLDYLFRGGGELPAPGSASCGEDKTPDDFPDCGTSC